MLEHEGPQAEVDDVNINVMPFEVSISLRFVSPVEGSCYRLATVLLNTDLPRLCFQMMAARSECPAKQTALVRSETGEF